MNKGILVVLVGALFVLTIQASDQKQARLAERIPFFEQRLHSKRWEVRYHLLGCLTGRDEETKRALEMLIRDKSPGVANQALVRYVNNFVTVDKTLFDPKVYVPGKFPAADLPDAEPRKTLVDYCLGRKEIAPKGIMCLDNICVLDPKKKDDPSMHVALTIVGILGRPEDAGPLHPFLESTNDYILVGAAKALLRLGDKDKALEALCRLTEKDPKEHLFYITEALSILKEVGHPTYKETVLKALAAVNKADGIQINWLNDFLLLAADVKSDVWE